MRTRHVTILAAVLGCLHLSAAATHASLISGVSIEAVSSELTVGNSGFDRLAQYVVDGSGLIGGAHDNSFEGISWDADTNGIAGPADTAPSITFDLGGLYLVDSFHVWNYNAAAGFNGRSVRDVSILKSNDGFSFTSLGSFQFAQAPGTSGYTGEVIDPTDFEARFIRFDIQSNHWDDLPAGVGLSEVQFSGSEVSAVPEPASLATLGLSVGCLFGFSGWRRTRRAVAR